jgi:hypothetical protein
LYQPVRSNWGQAAGVVLVRLVALRLQRHVRVPRLQHDHGQAARLQFSVQPGCQRAGLVADQVQAAPVDCESGRNRVRLTRHDRLEDDRTVEAVDDAERRIAGGDIQGGDKGHVVPLRLESTVRGIPVPDHYTSIAAQAAVPMHADRLADYAVSPLRSGP